MAHLAVRLRLWFRVDADLLATLLQFSTQSKNTDVFPLSFLNLVFLTRQNFEKPSFSLHTVWKSTVDYSKFLTPPQKKDI